MDVSVTRFINLFCNINKTFQIWIFLYALTCHSHAFDMQAFCDKEISMISQSVYQVEIELEDAYIYDRGGSAWLFSNKRRRTCETIVEGRYPTYDKLMFYFDDFDLECYNGYLEFYVGRTGYTRVTGLDGSICGENKPAGVFTVEDSYLRIKYTPRKSQYIKDVFSIIVTTYNDDTCESYSHKCDNSRCIDKDIACNDHDSCVDGSDCDTQTKSIIVGAAVGGLGAIGIIVGLVVCCICCKRKARKVPGTFQANSPTTVEYNASDNQGFSQPTYGVNYGCVNYGGPYRNDPPQYSATSTQILAGQQVSYAASYEQMQDLPPPYSEVAPTDQGRSQAQEADTPGGQSKTAEEAETPSGQSNQQQEPVYEEPENVCVLYSNTQTQTQS